MYDVKTIKSLLATESDNMLLPWQLGNPRGTEIYSLAMDFLT